MVDRSDELDFMFVHCKQIKPVIVGYEKRKVLLAAPIHWNSNDDDTLINSYSPANHERKISTGYIDKIALNVQDINELKIILDVDIFKK